MRPVFGTSFMCALKFLDSGVAGASDGAVGAGDTIPTCMPSTRGRRASPSYYLGVLSSRDSIFYLLFSITAALGCNTGNILFIYWLVLRPRGCMRGMCRSLRSRGSIH